MATAQEVIAAVQAGDAQSLRALLAQDRSLARARDENGVSALMHALYRQRKDLAEVLRAARPELDVFEAASLGRSDLVEEMVERDRRLANSHSGDGFTPLHFASFFGEERVGTFSARAIELQRITSVGAAGISVWDCGRPDLGEMGAPKGV